MRRPSGRPAVIGRVAVPVALVALLATACGSTGNGASPAPAPAAAGVSPSMPAGTVTISSRSGNVGTYLTDGSGRALYLFMSDTPTTSTCSGACATAWPPLIGTGTPAVADGAQAAMLGTLARADGTTQVTYGGHPLYYFAADTTPGTTKGQGKNGFGALWWLVDPAGTALTSATAPTSTGY